MKTQADEGMTLSQSQDLGLQRNIRMWKKLGLLQPWRPLRMLRIQFQTSSFNTQKKLLSTVLATHFVSICQGSTETDTHSTQGKQTALSNKIIIKKLPFSCSVMYSFIIYDYLNLERNEFK